MLGCVWQVLALYRTATQQAHGRGRGVDDTQGDDVRHILYKLGLRFRRIPPSRVCLPLILVFLPDFMHSFNIDPTQDLSVILLYSWSHDP